MWWVKLLNHNLESHQKCAGGKVKKNMKFFNSYRFFLSQREGKLWIILSGFFFRWEIEFISIHIPTTFDPFRLDWIKFSLSINRSTNNFAICVLIWTPRRVQIKRMCFSYIDFSIPQVDKTGEKQGMGRSFSQQRTCDVTWTDNLNFIELIFFYLLISRPRNKWLWNNKQSDLLPSSSHSDASTCYEIIFFLSWLQRKFIFLLAFVCHNQRAFFKHVMHSQNISLSAYVFMQLSSLPSGSFLFHC